MDIFKKNLGVQTLSKYNFHNVRQPCTRFKKISIKPILIKKKNLNPTQQNFTNKLNQNIIHTKQINKIKPPLQQNAASQRFNANSHKKKSYPLFAHVTKPRKVSLLKKKDHKAGNVDNTLMEQFFILLFAFPRTFPRAEAAFSHLGPTQNKGLITKKRFR